MARRPTPRELEFILRSPNKPGSRLVEVLKSLPEDVNPILAARAALTLVREDPQRMWPFARTCRRLPAPVIRAVLEQLEDVRRPHAFFLRELVPREARDSELTAAWEAAMQALLDLESSYAWGSKQQKAKFEALAGNPSILHALQTAVVASETVSLDMLAVLATDASDASVDALIPHVERAVVSQDWALDRLQHLRKHARSTPALDAMFARMQGLLTERKASSPALAFARELGFGEPATFWFHAYLASPAFDDVPAYRHQVHLDVDSRSATWFSVSLSELPPNPLDTTSRGTSFNNVKVYYDHLGVGPCEPPGFPGWLAAVASKLHTRWSFDTMSLRTSLRGQKRDQLERWLRGEA
jgi:hypothetical protein